jgi:hypothetical protein
VGELNGEIISLIICIRYPGHPAFTSTFLVKAEYRERAMAGKLGTLLGNFST